MHYNLKIIAAASVFLITFPVDAAVKDNSSVANPSVASEFVKMGQGEVRRQRRDEALRLNQPIQLAQSAELQEAEKLGQQVVQLYQQGKYTEAIPLAEKVLAIREKILGREHPDVATSLNNLAVLYWGKGDITRTTDFLTRGLAVQEKNLQLITEEAIKQLKTRSILHLATHGFFLPDKEIKPISPAINQLYSQFDKPQYVNLENSLLRSGLALAGFNNRQNKQSDNNTEDGVLTRANASKLVEAGCGYAAPVQKVCGKARYSYRECLLRSQYLNCSIHI